MSPADSSTPTKPSFADQRVPKLELGHEEQKHIVHFDKIPLYNGVNLINGFDSISINTPAEVIAYET